jgi:hypothetical protein
MFKWLLNGKFAIGCGPEHITPKYVYFGVCYNKQGSRTSYVCSSVSHCVNEHRLLSFHVCVSVCVTLMSQPPFIGATGKEKYVCCIKVRHYYRITEELSLHWQEVNSHLLMQIAVLRRAYSFYWLLIGQRSLRLSTLLMECLWYGLKSILQGM